MMQDCVSANKIKENKYKILRMSLLLGADDNRMETLNNFEDAAREIDTMNDEFYQKDLEDKFYDTTKLEDEEKKLTVLVDYIGGRVEQRISLLSDFANVTGFDLANLPPIKYYDKLDDYKERLKYIREYLENTEQINILNQEITEAENKLNESYKNKATSEECNQRNEEILLKKFENILKSIDEFKNIDENNIDSKLKEVISEVDDSRKSLEIFSKSFATLSGSGISFEEKSEYKSYVDNAKDVYYNNKEQEYLLRIYYYLLRKETEYNQILIKREAINDLLYERLDLRRDLELNDIDQLISLYDILERQYDDIKRQKDNIDNIESLTELIELKREQLNGLEIDNQKVEILALLREYGLIDTYIEETPSFNVEEIPLEMENNYFEDETNDIISSEDENLSENSIPQELNINIPTQEETISESVISTEKAIEETKEEVAENVTENVTEEVKDNEVILVENATKIDLDFVQAKASKVMQRVGEMLGIKTNDSKVISVENEKTPIVEVPQLEPPNVEDKKIEEPKIEEPKEESVIMENPLFNNEINISQPVEEEEPSNFWFESETPDALNELPDLEVSNDNFFANNNIPDLNFPDLKLNFGNDEEGK